MVKSKRRKKITWFDSCEKDGGKVSLEKEKSASLGNRHPHKILKQQIKKMIRDYFRENQYTYHIATDLCERIDKL